MRIEAASVGDLATVRTLLADAGLPVDDLHDARPSHFLVAREADGAVIGVIGLERYDKAGLLRSLAVQTASHRQGLGAQLTEALERHAGAMGVETLYLLTTTAKHFFAAHGYQYVERGRVPKAIADTAEFKSLCPSTAACMCKRLD
ncbi:MAG: arsenic resistance N-acetyltransferase ArsN2 [Gammaproteobacteria bacterium]